MPRLLLAVLVLLCAFPAAAAADSDALTLGITGHGTLSTDGPHTCTSPASTPEGTESDCTAFNANPPATCTSNQARTLVTCKLGILPVAPAGWRFDHLSGACTTTLPGCQIITSFKQCTTGETGECGAPQLQGPWTVVAHFVDTRAPTITAIDGPADNAVVVSDTRQQSFTFTTNEDDEAPAFQCQRDGGAFGACANPHVWAALPDGIHTLCVKATDPSGLASTNTPCRSWEQETTPTAALLSAPPAATTATSATFTYTSNKAAHPADGSTLSYECRLDAGAFAPCAAGGKTVAQLNDGAHQFSVRAVFHGALQAAGAKIVSQPATSAWTVDTTPPETAIASGPADGSTTVDVAPTFAFGANEPASGFRCRIDGADAVPCASPFTLPTLASGPHTFAVAAVDAVGNVDPTPAAHAFTLITGLATIADADHDGFPEGLDCNDHDAAVFPGAPDVLHDGIDQNCDGRDAPYPVLSVTVSISVGYHHKYTAVTLLPVTGAPAGATVTLNCASRRLGCPFARKTVAVKSAARLSLGKYFKGAKLRKGARIDVLVSRPGFVGTVYRYTVRLGTLPSKKVLCTRPGETTPRASC